MTEKKKEESKDEKTVKLTWDDVQDPVKNEDWLNYVKKSKEPKKK